MRRFGNAGLWDRLGPPGPVPARRLRILVHAPNHLGDNVMAVPFVAELRAKANGPIAVVTREEYLPVWQRLGGGVAAIPYSGWCRSEVRRLRGLLARQRNSVAFLLATGVEVAWLYRRAGVRHRVGYDHWGRGFLLTRRLRSGGEPTDPSLVREHFQQNLFRLLDATDLAPGGGAPVPRRRPVPAGSDASLGLVLGGETPDKRLPLGFWLSLVARVAARHPLRELVLLGTAAHAPVAAGLARRFPASRDHTGRTTVAELARALEDCDLVVGPDSGAAHLAAALGTPTVTLFTSGSPTWTRPMGASSSVVTSGLPCAPCFNRTPCGHGHRCAASLDPAEVASLVTARLDEQVRPLEVRSA